MAMDKMLILTKNATRANVAYSRATNLTILACPINMHAGPRICPTGQSAVRTMATAPHPGRRCSVGYSKRYQPQSVAEQDRKAQAYSFEALHKIYFYDAWSQSRKLSSHQNRVYWCTGATGPANRLPLRSSQCLMQKGRRRITHLPQSPRQML